MCHAGYSLGRRGLLREPQHESEGVLRPPAGAVGGQKHVSYA